MTAKYRTSKLFEDIRYLGGVGPARADRLANLGLYNVYDLLFHLPRDYEDRRSVTPVREVREGESAVISGHIFDVNFKRLKSRRCILEVFVSDDTGIIALTWFNARAAWSDRFVKGERIIAYGKVQYYEGPQMVSPDCSLGDDAGESPDFKSILPVYPATEGLSQKVLRRIVRTAVNKCAAEVADVIPPPLVLAKGFGGKEEALKDIHFPPSPEAAAAARKRLGYEELLVFQTALALQRRTVKNSKGFSFKTGANVEKRIRRLFPFKFTDAQDAVIEEIRRDLRSERPMHRLLQGDVGCGKTAVAVFALLSVIAESREGYQAAFMAPTEVLAEQHFLTLEKLLAGSRVRIMLLKGSATPAERAAKNAVIAEGGVDLAVGTHALIQQDVRFNRLALAVIDEQHRFGVHQRLQLTRKGLRPDVLLMTATPIPRTMTLACFGDMDVSVIDRMPPGRQPVSTFCLPPGEWPRAYENALDELRAGRRAFVIFPLVETNEELDLTSATEAFRKLKDGLFSDFPCCLMHGRMTAERKRETMEGFRSGAFQVMIATTVIEVGIDVPEATVMIVQHAERLGLSQLHQLRGRIGRGRRPGYCYLLADPSTEDAWKRLEVLAVTSDGFKIAEEDLRLRGPGEIFGARQSGMPEFRACDLSDLSLLKEVREDAFRLVENDPVLGNEHNRLLQKAVKQRYKKHFILGAIG